MAALTAGGLGRTAVAERASDGALGLWNGGPTRQAILRFVDEVTDAGSPSYVPPAERIAVFDKGDFRTVFAPAPGG